MLTSAGKVLFTGDGSGNFVAFDAANGKPLWHSRIGNISNAPQTYLLDGSSPCSSRRRHALLVHNVLGFKGFKGFTGFTGSTVLVREALNSEP